MISNYIQYKTERISNIVMYVFTRALLNEKGAIQTRDFFIFKRSTADLNLEISFQIGYRRKAKEPWSPIRNN